AQLTSRVELSAGKVVVVRIHARLAKAVADRLGDLFTQRIEYGHRAHVHSALAGEFHVPPRARVDLDQTTDAVARVALEFGAEHAAITDVREQRRHGRHRVGDGRRIDALEEGAVAEVRRVHPQAASDEQRAAPTVTVDETF